LKNSKKDLVMATATRLFAERGFENTSVDMICEAAGVSKGLVYHHFKNKNQLLREIFSEATRKMIEINDQSKAVSNPNAQLVALIEQLFDQLKTDKSFFQLNLNIMLQPSTRSILNDLIKERSTHLFNSVKGIFKEIDSENTEVLSYIFIAELDGIALDYLTVFENYPIEKVKQHLIKKYEKW
jgi:AcrR family transcriptional regulator